MSSFCHLTTGCIVLRPGFMGAGPQIWQRLGTWDTSSYHTYICSQWWHQKTLNMVMICYDRIDRIDRIDCLFVKQVQSLGITKSAQEMIQSPSDGLQWPGWKNDHVTRHVARRVFDGERWWAPWAMGHGSEEMDFHPRTCPKSWRRGNCKQIHKISQISEEIGWDWLFFHELNREISWNLMKFHISSMLQIWPHAPHAVRVEIWILSISRWSKLWLQSHPWLGVRRQVASGGVRWRRRSRNSRHLRFFVFPRIREKLNNSGHL